MSLFDTEDQSKFALTLGSARTGIIATTLGTKAFFLGGSLDDTSRPKPYPTLPVDSLDIFDSSDGSWTSSTLPFAWHKGAATGVGDLIFLAGGYTLDSSGREVPLPLTVYNVKEDRWYNPEEFSLPSGIR